MSELTYQKPLAEIESEYNASLVIPDEKAKIQFFFCPVGLSGTGKSTVARKIAERFNLVRISSDELRKILKENHYDYSPLKEILFRTVNALARQGHGIAFDMNCGNPQTKEAAESLAAELGIRAAFVHVTAPEEIVFERFRHEKPFWLADDPEIRINNHLAQKETRDKLNIPFDFLHIFDTSKPDMERQIDKCCEKISAFIQ